jgi:TrwC relaxase
MTAMLTGRHPGDRRAARPPPRRRARPDPQLRPHLLGAEVRLAHLGASRRGSAEVAAAHKASVAAAFDYMQRNACWTRRGHGGHEFVRDNGFIAAAYLHRSSRAGDPQLHTHVLAATAPNASARARQVATLETRKAKDRDLTEESLRERWRSLAAEIGLDRDAIRRTFGHEREAGRAKVAASAVEEALTARASHFDRRDVIQAVADRRRLAPRPPRSRNWPTPSSGSTR